MKSFRVPSSLLLVAACSSSSSSSHESAVALPAKLDCQNILADTLRAKYLAGATLTDHPEPFATTGKCMLKTATGGTGSVLVSCAHRDGLDNAASIRVLKKSFPRAQDLVGVGRGGIIVPDDAATFVTVWDDDSPCSVTMNLPKPIDGLAFTKDLIAALPPK